MNRNEATRCDVSHSLSTYLHDINEVALLTADDERRLAVAIERGDEEARARMISANLRLVVRIARDFQGRGMSLDDLIGEGNLGLIRAAKDFDPGFGVRFSTYAGYWIKQSIRQALVDTTPTIRIPHHLVGTLTEWRRAEAELSRELGRAPEFDEVAGRLGLSELQKSLVAKAKKAQGIKAEGHTDDDGDSWSADESAAPDFDPAADLEGRDERDDLLRRMAALDDRERLVVSHHYGLDGAETLNLKQIGERLGFTREWVRKIERRALAKLRAAGREAAIA
ncbi:sigma-70 family RNA polymerase sigma factor [Paludisphaera soli]|uniref:sigma-70 family RNA polymerase sigma factor n=1 Tax=Paludisphaera soli TaxID=2712865 RepID=UPI0013EA08FE|nr:RNA polymerase sigma factor RpoD/SigA [Paludisphaera soli]